MARIESVYFSDCIRDGHDDVTLDITLNNGQSVWLPLKDKIDSRYFTRLISGKGIGIKPETDGSNVYWRDGPRLSFEIIMRMVEG